MSNSNKSSPSTRDLIAGAEAMAKPGKKDGAAPSTRQLVNDAEQLLGRKKKSSMPLFVGVALVLIAVGVAVVFLL